MSKVSRLHQPTPNTPVRIPLTEREFKNFYGLCAIAVMKTQAIQQEAAQRIEAAQQERQQVLNQLLKKYRAAGMRPDVDYRFDEATHSLIAPTQGV